MRENHPQSYNCWLQYNAIDDVSVASFYRSFCQSFVVLCDRTPLINSAIDELQRGITSLLGETPTETGKDDNQLVLGTLEDVAQEDILDRISLANLNEEGYCIRMDERQHQLYVLGKTEKGILYAVFHLLRKMQLNEILTTEEVIEQPVNQIRMMNHWDNVDGSIERGYAGLSFFYQQNRFSRQWDRMHDYARMLASIGINAVTINNVNVHQVESEFITAAFLPDVARTADIFRAYNIKLFLSANYSSPMQLGGLSSADPLADDVREWWKEKASEIYAAIPDFGGFVIKADSENRPGPFTYGRTHADGANMLGEALAPHGGILIWRCFVYNCHQDWRDKTTDRARAAYDHFMPLDGQFNDNVILQIKNGPMDFQVREGVSPLLGAMKDTNQILEFQIAQEYTGQQKHLCYLVPQWKDVLNFDTYAKGEGSFVKDVASGSLYERPLSGIAAVANSGDAYNWTGHPLAQANLYGYGRLVWNPELSADAIASEWITQTYGNHATVLKTIKEMLLQSLQTYENYTAPLGVGWMVNPNHHYGPNVDGYEYSAWGTYHFADLHGIGVDRTMQTGTGYTSQYFPENEKRYESLEACPDELVLFFHHVPYTHQLHSGKSVIQHIYDTHFEGAEQAEQLREQWKSIKELIDEERFNDGLTRFNLQVDSAKEWRDIINTYFYRKSGIEDEHGRTIYS
ncbi:alpha-glucuronidase family glycosyl hydrolase [Aureibacillus halotolerans]